jgi:NAD-dependent SIR2 family protein deacetylase
MENLLDSIVKENKSNNQPNNYLKSIPKFIKDRLISQLKYDRFPLFVLGAGISKGVVPLLSEIGTWLLNELPNSNINDALNRVRKHTTALSENNANRRQVAELFSTIQEINTQYESIWNKFSQGFIRDRLEIKDQPFEGLCNVNPSPAHYDLAEILSNFKCYIMSLNFDGLTYKALKEIRLKNDDSTKKGALVVHSAEEAYQYFTATSKDFLPVIFKVRGDVFYACCTEPACPMYKTQYPLDRSFPQEPISDLLKCPICSNGTLRLQFSFPGYRAKEEAAYPMLWKIRRFLASRLSAVIVIGLSGRWDGYLIRFLFDLVSERKLLFVDVNPRKQSEVNFIDDFRLSYYKSIPDLNKQKKATDAAFISVPMLANDFSVEMKELFNMES